MGDWRFKRSAGPVNAWIVLDGAAALTRSVAAGVMLACLICLRHGSFLVLLTLHKATGMSQLISSDRPHDPTHRQLLYSIRTAMNFFFNI